MHSRPPRKEQERWAAAELARKSYGHFRAGWQGVPAEARSRFLKILAAGWLAGAVVTVALVWLGKHLEQAGLLGWEDDVLRWLGRPASPISFGTGMWIAIAGNSAVVVPIAVLAAGWSAWKGRPLRAAALAVSPVAYKLLIGVGWYLWHRQRPNLLAQGIASPDGWSSFPSGHVVQATAIYGLLAWFWMRETRFAGEKALAVLLAAALTACAGIGRMRVGAHWPTDLVAGLVIGAVWLGVVVVALRAGGDDRRTSGS